MRTFAFSLLLAGATLAGAPASATVRPAAPWGPQAVQACTLAATGPCVISTITRRSLSADVAEYSFTMKVGPGQHDVIGMHRVVKELGAFQSAPPSSGIFFVHGDVLGFDAAFLASAASPSIPDTHALPVYLAERGVDVWGIDMRWILVDPSTGTFGFMQSWGLALNANDVGTGLAIAAGVRGTNEPMNLLGWSRGGQIGYTYLSTEAALPLAQRRVKGFITVDIYARTDDPTLRQFACNRLTIRNKELTDGKLADKTGQLAGALGQLAVASPNTESPFTQPGPNGEPPLFPPGTTNSQAALLVGAATFNLLAPNPPTAAYHWTGGTFGTNGFPTGLNFTDQTYFHDYLSGAAPFESTKLIADAEAMTCENDDTPFLDNLADVTVPILYVGADGGFGTTGFYSTTLLGSTDRETLLIDRTPGQLNDYGHSDLFLASDAETLVWSPIYDWILGFRQQ